MKTVGSLIAGIGLLAAIALGVIPTHVSVLGSSGSCGLPVLGVLQSGYGQDPFDTAIQQQCKSQSTERIAAAVALGLGASVIGMLIGGIGVVVGAVGGGSRRDERRWAQLPPQLVYVPGSPPTVGTPVDYSAPGLESREPGQQWWQRVSLTARVSVAVLVLVGIALAAFLIGRAGRGDAPSAGVNSTAGSRPTDALSTAPGGGPVSSRPTTPVTSGVGYGSVKIGMSLDDLKHSDLVEPDTDWATVLDSGDGGCAMVPLTPRDGIAMLQPDTRQVAAIQFGSEMKTSRGIGLGSTTAELTKAYPANDWAMSGMDGGDQVRVNDTARYYIGVGATGQVEQLILAADTQACFD